MYLILGMGIGLVIMLQGVFNRIISSKGGLSTAFLINNTVCFIFSILLFFLIKYVPQLFPSEFAFSSIKFKLWYIIPGIFGVIIVAGIPFLIAKGGAQQVFLAIIAGQIISSILWDTLVDGIPLSLPKVAGGALCFTGVVLSTFK